MERDNKGKNYSVEEILFGKNRKTNRVIKDIHTISEEQQKRNKISKMLSSYKLKDNNITFDF